MYNLMYFVALYWITDKLQKSVIQITPDIIKLFYNVSDKTS